ncbi:hypothetical protein [Mycetocola zhujimingii]|uniref:hypothetical protein n=1 Tax=Mycetocola zhujimingii TaxID=2079792 RepID=UPI000D373FFC|nr:hypothetical protein [Mycetocola zhujimingii]AWB88126.1 hypothetical protein C3E77_15225 [Mycetocola zhujimingii]
MTDPQAQARAEAAQQAVAARYGDMPVATRVDAIIAKLHRRQRMLDGWATDFNRGHGINAALAKEQRLQLEAEQTALRAQLDRDRALLHVNT